MIKKMALGAALFLSLLATAQASSFNVALDGYCNTFALTVQSGLIAGTRGGCGYTVIDGGAIAKVNGVVYRLTADTNDGSLLFTWYFTAPVQGHGNWYLYASDGTSDTLYNQGTYTRTQSAATSQGQKDATQK
jgi:hypothetical protein